MRVKRLAATVAAILVGASPVVTPASAQRIGSVEVGAFGQYTIFGDLIDLDNALGFGGMVGLFILPNLVAEGDIAL